MKYIVAAMSRRSLSPSLPDPRSERGEGGVRGGDSDHASSSFRQSDSNVSQGDT